MNDILTRYPVLARMPEHMRAEAAAKADAGLPLSAEENEAMELPPCASLVLIPVCGLTPDLRTTFGGDWNALRHIIQPEKVAS